MNPNQLVVLVRAIIDVSAWCPRLEARFSNLQNFAELAPGARPGAMAGLDDLIQGSTLSRFCTIARCSNQ
jgi:hypothetical protein